MWWVFPLWTTFASLFSPVGYFNPNYKGASICQRQVGLIPLSLQHDAFESTSTHLEICVKGKTPVTNIATVSIYLSSLPSCPSFMIIDVLPTRCSGSPAMPTTTVTVSLHTGFGRLRPYAMRNSSLVRDFEPCPLLPFSAHPACLPACLLTHRERGDYETVRRFTACRRLHKHHLASLISPAYDGKLAWVCGREG